MHYAVSPQQNEVGAVGKVVHWFPSPTHLESEQGLPPHTLISIKASKRASHMVKIGLRN